ncbi:MAG: GNAT family N-acetyltransferase, partial [Oscillospiraceae bacterium]
MKVRITEDGDIPQLKKLWKAIFDFDGGYTELFFKYRYPTCQGIGLFDGDKLLSAQYLIPCKLNIGDACFDIKYVFAVATFPELQGRGYNTFLLNETEKYAHKNNIAGMALMPANEGLFDYY